MHRYLFVMARFNKDAVKQPDLVKLPDLPAKSEAKPADQPAANATPTPPAKEGDAAADRDRSTTPRQRRRQRRSEPAKDKPAAATDAAKPAEGAEKKDDAAAKTGAEPDKELEKVMAERKEIEKENQRKNDEYQALLKKGEENVKDLNLRFGDWYFVVDDDVFQKVRVSRDKVVKKKDTPKAEGEASPGGPGAGIPGLPAIPGASK